MMDFGTETMGLSGVQCNSTNVMCDITIHTDMCYWSGDRADLIHGRGVEIDHAFSRQSLILMR